MQNPYSSMTSELPLVLSCAKWRSVIGRADEEQRDSESDKEGSASLVTASIVMIACGSTTYPPTWHPPLRNDLPSPFRGERSNGFAVISSRLGG